ncbi:MAG: hypothetical protein LBU46_02520 [Candidatus Accumulibacter sp.]|jgi:hypothetical protein|nr:hypothetical protein [Accumulibacter sp.]
MACVYFFSTCYEPENSIKLFEDKAVRTHWDAKQETWFFFIVDVVGVLTGQTTARGASNYWAKKRLRRPMPEI